MCLTDTLGQARAENTGSLLPPYHYNLDVY